MIEMNTLTPTEYKHLRVNAGWGDPEVSDIMTALENTLATFTKRINGNAVGCARIIGDGRLCFYIQDLIVHDSVRRRGIASELMESVMKFLDENAAPNAFIGLMAAKGVDHFYLRYGFIPRPNEHLGPGMVQFFKRPGETSEA
jgi:predicted GNAT family N-acyltransferase